MHCRYHIHVLEVPRQAGELWGTEVDGASDASQQLATLLRAHRIDQCSVIEVAAQADGHVGFRVEQAEHARAVSSVYRHWFVVDVLSRGSTCLPASSDVVGFGSTTLLLAQEPNVQAVIDYELATKKHFLKLRHGRPSTPPRRPKLFDLIASHGRPGVHLEPIVEALAEYGGVAFFRMSASRATLVTWTREPVAVWLARWEAAVPDQGDVRIVDDLPVD
jgi:hypothetical protein